MISRKLNLNEPVTDWNEGKTSNNIIMNISVSKIWHYVPTSWLEDLIIPKAD